MPDDWRQFLVDQNVGDSLAPGDDWRQFVPEETSGGESLLRGLAQGISFGFADEISGAIESIFTDKTYEQARDESRGNFGMAEADNPKLFSAGSLVGDVATLVVPGGIAAKAGTKVAATAGRALAKGAALGGAHAAGRAEDNVAEETVKGALMGSVLYGAGHAGKRAISSVTTAAKDPSAINDFLRGTKWRSGRRIASKLTSPSLGTGLLGGLASDSLTGFLVGSTFPYIGKKLFPKTAARLAALSTSKAAPGKAARAASNKAIKSAKIHSGTDLSSKPRPRSKIMGDLEREILRRHPDAAARGGLKPVKGSAEFFKGKREAKKSAKAARSGGMSPALSASLKFKGMSSHQMQQEVMRQAKERGVSYEEMIKILARGS